MDIGRKKKFDEESAMECVRVPKSKRKEYREAIKQCVAEKFVRNGDRGKGSPEKSKPKLFGSIVINHPEKFADIVEFIKNLPRKESDGDDRG